MTHYVPVLKGMPGELAAWKNKSSNVTSGSTPIFEVVPKHGADKDLANFSARALVALDSGETVVPDSGYLDQLTNVAGSGMGPVAWLGRELSRGGLFVRPVVRLDDPVAVLSEAAAVAATGGRGVTLRLGGYETDPDPVQASLALPQLLTNVGLGTTDIHLVIDLFEIKDSRDLSRALRTADDCLVWAAGYSWASVTLVSGAFPASVSNFAKGAATMLDRFDAQLYRDVSVPAGLALDFGDYTVNNPVPPSGNARSPLPAIRYTAGREWLVWREAKALPGNESFYTVCKNLVACPEYRGATYSWGDAEIARCSTSTPGAGTGGTWRSFGTSHHLETVVDRLSSLGEP